VGLKFPVVVFYVNKAPTLWPMDQNDPGEVGEVGALLYLCSGIIGGKLCELGKETILRNSLPRVANDLDRFCHLADQQRLNEAMSFFQPLASRVYRLSISQPKYTHVLESVARLLDHDVSLLPRAKEMLFRATTGKIVDTLDRRSSAMLDLAEGIIAFYDGNGGEALRMYDLALQNAKRIRDWHLTLAATYYITKAHYKSDRYEEALNLAQSIRAIPGSGYSLLRGLIQLMEAWILFVEGDVPAAEKLLGRAEKLVSGKDHIEAANIVAFKGRIARRLGRFQESVTLYAEAIKSLRADETNPALVRCYAQQAFSLLHLADSLGASSENSSVQLAGRTRQQAYEALQAVYPAKQNELSQRRTGARVYYTLAVYFLGLGQTDRALQEIEKALNLGRQYGDRSMEINSLIVQSWCAGGRSVEVARRIMDLADKTDNRRLRARARIALGEAFLFDSYRNVPAAKQMEKEAGELLNDSDRDYVRVELDRLQSRLAHIHEKDNLLFEVTRSGAALSGLTKTVRTVETRIVEDAWRSADGNISEVAKMLKTTRSRVRRVLERREVRAARPIKS
jgi:tetratricopeptide (TPR) repeat protein